VSDIYEQGLDPNPANYAPLSPISFLRRSALAYPDKVAVIDQDRRYTYRELEERSRRLASALIHRGIGQGDTVAIMAPNAPTAGVAWGATAGGLTSENMLKARRMCEAFDEQAQACVVAA